MSRFLARLWLGRYREELLGGTVIVLFGALLWVGGWRTLLLLWGIVLTILAVAWVWVVITEYVTSWAQRHVD